jgi:LPS-assembly lipoprotein
MQPLKIIIGLCVAAALPLGLAGCSHKPLYGRDSAGNSAASALGEVAIDDQKTRAGQLLRNELILSFGGSGSSARYVLKLDVTEETQSVSSVAYEKTARLRYHLSAKYVLVDASGQALTEGSSFSAVPFDTIDEPVADIRAAENARERASRELAQDIRLRISAYLATRAS